MNNTIDKNKSYCNKDFQSVYEELLDLVPKLTTKWNPSNSDESDPGVVLIKLMAVLADKLNYNIDKQILERSPLSVTQRRNAQELYNLIGYRMKWYRAASVDVEFQVNNVTLLGDILINRFTQLTDADNQISFVTTKAVRINKLENKFKTYSVRCLQGVLQELKVNDNSSITLDDLDENYRVYLPHTNIAENAIFISESQESNVDYEWTLVDNIEAQPLNSRVFAFNASDESVSPYIQFPSDIGNFSSNTLALTIRYLTTEGASGNISKQTLTNFANDITYAEGVDVPVEESNIVTDLIRIRQSKPAYFGSDPETINDAYRNSRRIINTFNTLVTRIDYQNYIRRYLGEDGRPIVSNCVVADRTCELNYSYRCVGLEDFQVKIVTGCRAKIGTSETYEAAWSAYDVIVFGLTPSEDYNKAFTPFHLASLKNQVENAVSEVKSVNQDFYLPLAHEDGSLIYGFHNLYTLRGQIVTTDKISAADASELELKIKEALKVFYSAYNVEFGEPIDYEELLERIRGVDPRIKTVALDNPSYVTKKIFKASEGEGLQAEEDLSYVSDEDKLDILARTIAAGNLQLFNFNEYFNKDFGQTSISEGDVTNILSIALDTEVTLDNDAKNAYEIKENEVIQLIRPMYSNKIEYNLGCELFIAGTFDLLKDTPYKLISNDRIKVRYQNEKGIFVTTSYGPGDWVVSSREIKSTNTNLLTDLRDEDKEEYSPANQEGLVYKYHVVGTGQTFANVCKNKYDMKTGELYLLVLNRKIDTLTINKEEEYILDIGEYFMYTSPQMNELMVLGSGTSIFNPSTSDDISLKAHQEDIESMIEDMTEAELINMGWTELKAPIHIIENEITNLGHGTSIYISVNNQDNEQPITLKQLNKEEEGDTYTFSPEDWTKLDEGTKLNISFSAAQGGGDSSIVSGENKIFNECYKIRVRMSISASTEYVSLYKNQKLFYITEEDGKNNYNGNIFKSTSYITPPTTNPATENILLSFNSPIIALGGTINKYGKESNGTYKSNLAIYPFTQNKITYRDSVNSPIILKAGGETNSLVTTVKDASDAITGYRSVLPFNFKFGSTTPLYYFIPIQIAGISEEDMKKELAVTCELIGTFKDTEGVTKTSKSLLAARDIFSSTPTETIYGDNCAYILTIQKSDLANGGSISGIEIKWPKALERIAIKVGKIYIADSININEMFHSQSAFKYDSNWTNEGPNNYLEKLMQKITDIAWNRTSAKEFNWINKVSVNDKCLYPAESYSFFDVNHPYNKYVIPKMDLENYNITVNGFSIRK